MNSKLEKWITVSALVGWTTSMGSLAFLALRTASPATASRPLPPLVEPSIRLNSEMTGTAHRVTSTIPTDTTKEFWLNSIRSFSTSPEIALNSLGLSTQPTSDEGHNNLPANSKTVAPNSVDSQKGD